MTCIRIDKFPERQELEAIFKKWFDAIWRACGIPKSYNYDDNGNWGKGVNVR